MPRSDPTTFRESSSDITAPAAGFQMLFAKATGLFRRRNGEAAKRLLDEDDLLPPTAGASDRKVRTAGNLTLNSTTWANADTALDLVIPAVVGDWIEVGLVGFWNNEAVVGRLDAVSVVAGSPVNSWANASAPDDTYFGVGGWFGPSGAQGNIGGSVVKQVVAGDISGGTVTLRLRYRTSTAANKTLFAATITPLVFWAQLVSGQGDTGPAGPPALTFSKAGTLAVGAGTFRWYAKGAWTITQVRASVGTAPTGASLIVDVNKSGTTIFTTQSNRPTIAVSTNTDLADAIDVTALADGDYLTVDIDQVGSTIAGADLTVQVWMEPA